MIKKTIGELIKDRPEGIVSVEISDSLEAAVRVMNAERVGSVIVMDMGRPVGIVTERDVIKCIADPGCAGDVTVRSAMSKGLRVVETTDTVEHARSVMQAKRIRHLPVVEDGRLVSVISVRDVAMSEVEELHEEVKSLMDYMFTGS